ncbi:MAG: hypothetical protein ACR2LC_10780 [Pyrinomonadaceae bacterium]
MFGKGKPRVDQLAGKIVVVVGGSVDDAKRLAKKMSWIPESSIYADPTDSAAAALGLQGTPVIVGMRRNSIEWNFAGLPQTVDNLKSMVTSWCNQ